MRRHQFLGLTMAALATATSLVAAGGPARADSARLLHVDNTGLHRPCSDTGSGSVDQPFCTLAAGVAAAGPDTTVTIRGAYDEPLRVTKSGTPGKPVRFVEDGREPGARVAGDRAGVTVDGQHDVEIAGLTVIPNSGAAIAVANSTRITVAGIESLTKRAQVVRLTAVTDSVVRDVQATGNWDTTGAVSLDAATTGVTVTGASFAGYYNVDVGVRVYGSRNSVLGNTFRGRFSAGVRIEAGAVDNVVASNTFLATSYPFLGVESQGSGTSITNNTFTGDCSLAFHVWGAPRGVTVQNNVVDVSGDGCDGGTVGMAVTGAAVSGTTVDYNTVRATDGALPYLWSEDMITLAEFRAVSGQGAHDLDAPGTTVNVDSANSAAPGYVAVDQLGRGRQDNPGVANSGAGPVTYADRGATEQVRAATARLTLSASEDGRTVTADAGQSTPGWTPIVSYSFDFEGVTVTQAGPVASRTLEARDDNHTVTVTVTDGAGLRSQWSATIQPGDGYVPVGPVRVLDTRTGTGAGRTVPLGPGETLALRVADRDGVPATGVTSVTMNVTVTEPTGPGVLTVRPYGVGSQGPTSNLNWTPGLTVANLVVVGVRDGRVEYVNTSAGTVHVVADLVGYHLAARASRFVPQDPVRVLDTRERTGVDSTTPVAPGGTLTLPVTGRAGVPATGVTAVTLNVTATAPTAAGFLTVYPNGRPLPNASTLNWTPGLTVPNLVVVPVVNGKVDFRNTGAGTVHLVADLVGYHTTDVGDAFHAHAPQRLLDTRERIGTAGTTPVPPNGEIMLDLRGLAGRTGPITAVVLNVTVTGPTAHGFLTVHSGYQGPRPNASNLNWGPGQTVPNLVVVPVDTAVRFHNTGPGTVHVVADLYGYYTR
ncbi:right-handed parallel beta-helix repeat-containing protein [Longispora sp. NPDC051575]|uniref:right-handed parallel beta-helix repeat-containing protein n=1 Tax=Longispora sp. NPDC051575 TaxID=3154943 RepID=UPI0034343380